jgi:hypothetical protein
MLHLNSFVVVRDRISTHYFTSYNSLFPIYMDMWNGKGDKITSINSSFMSDRGARMTP